jgi:DNA-binding PadR family transcriptional regulator
MQELALLLLTALANGSRHGYAIAQEVRSITDGRVSPRTGALYGALDRLLAEGLIRWSARRWWAAGPAGSSR